VGVVLLLRQLSALFVRLWGSNLQNETTIGTGDRYDGHLLIGTALA